MMAHLIAAAVGGRGRVVDLSNVASSYEDTSAATTTYRVTITFQTNGTIDIARTVGSDSPNVQTDFILPNAQLNLASVRMQKDTGTDLTGGDAQNTWHALTSERSFYLEYTSSGGNDKVTWDGSIDVSFDGGTSTHTTQDIDLIAGENS
jgi:hypothetical protein